MRDFHLDTNSSSRTGATVDSTINCGDFALTPLVDFDGVSVPQNTARDMGALDRVDHQTRLVSAVRASASSPWKVP
jgi:hypothetical protein